MEEQKIIANKTNARRINNLIKRIRMTRDEWCSMVNDELKKINTYEQKADSDIIIEALQHFLWEEEEEVETLYEREEEQE